MPKPMDGNTLPSEVGQRIIVGTDVEITVIQVQGRRVQLRVRASNGISVKRSELLQRTPADYSQELSRLSEFED